MQERLSLGEQHDAQEALEDIFTQSLLGRNVFSAGAPGQRPDTLTLPPFEPTGWWHENFAES
eukprot:660633-Karenia_brevis.AAC.1